MEDREFKELEMNIDRLSAQILSLKKVWSDERTKLFEKKTGFMVGAIVVNKDDEKQSAEGRMRNGRPLIVRAGVINRITWTFGLHFPFIFVNLFNKDGTIGVMEQKIDRFEWRIVSKVEMGRLLTLGENR